MNRILSVCFLVLVLVVGMSVFVLNESIGKVRAAGQTNPELQKGISVQMAASSHAAPMPDADNRDAWIVAVTNDGRVFFGTESVTADELTEQMKMRPRNRDAKLYVKADASAPFSTVRQVLHAAQTVFFDDVVLLTSQPEAAQPRTIVPPKGLDVWIGSERGSNPLVVQLSSELGTTTVKINNEEVSISTLQGRLAQLFDNRSGRIVVVKASAKVPYEQVVRAIDASRAAGASRVSMPVSPEI